MRNPVYQLILALLLLIVPGTVCADSIHFPGLGPGGGGGTGTSQNLIVGPGIVSITGSGNGTDQINGVAQINGKMYADNFPGADIGAKVNNAIAALGTGGGTVMLPAGFRSFNTTMQCPVDIDKPVIIQGAGAASDFGGLGTMLYYSGNGDAVNQMAQPQLIRGCELRDLTLDGGTGGPNAVGFHFGGTLYSRTHNVMFRSFQGAGIEVDDEPVSGTYHFTERYDFSQTAFTVCNTDIYFHNGNPPGQFNSFMHGRMDIWVGLFGAENAIVLDGGGWVGGVVADIDGNYNPPSTGSLIKLVNNSYFSGRVTNLTECGNPSTPCIRLDVDPTSHFGGQVFGAAQGPTTDKEPPGSEVQMAYADTRFMAPVVTTCMGIYGLNPGQSGEMFTIQNWGSWAAGPLTIGARNPGYETVRTYNLAASTCSGSSSLSVAQETIYGGGAAPSPFTVTETCHPAAVIGNGTAATPQYPAGSETYAVVNNSTQAATISFSFLNTLYDSSRIVGPVPEICF